MGRLLRFLEKMKNANVFRIVQLMMSMCLIAHWISCFWKILFTYLPHSTDYVGGRLAVLCSTRAFTVFCLVYFVLLLSSAMLHGFDCMALQNCNMHVKEPFHCAWSSWGSRFASNLGFSCGSMRMTIGMGHTSAFSLLTKDETDSSVAYFGNISSVV